VPIPDHPIRTRRCHSIARKSDLAADRGSRIKRRHQNIVEQMGCAWRATSDDDEQYCFAVGRYDSATFDAVDALG
jgi:hypothetical protein